MVHESLSFVELNFSTSLAILDLVQPKNVQDFHRSLRLRLVADQLVHRASFPNVVFKGVDEFLVSLHRVGIDDMRLDSKEQLSTLVSTTYGRCVRKDCICIDGFVPAMNVCRLESRLVVLPEWVR